MRLLDQFVIREQEVFACRVLTYLMHRSPELRDGTIRAINRCRGMSSHYLQIKDAFSIVPEWHASSEDSPENSGRLDILLEIDNAVIGIEAKLNAELAADQPRKYLGPIVAHAQSLSKLRPAEMRPVCVLLGPHSQKKHYLEHVDRLPAHPSVSVGVLAWEELFEAWRDTRATDPVALFVADELENLVLTQTGSRTDFRELYHRLCSGLADAKHDDHLRFVGWIYPAFRGNDMPYMRVKVGHERDRQARTYIGYYFAGSIDPAWGWYGFVEPQFAGDAAGDRPALVMGTDFDVRGLDPGIFKPIQFTHPGFPAPRKWWRIHFDETWKDLTRWQSALKPVREALQRVSREKQVVAESQPTKDAPITE